MYMIIYVQCLLPCVSSPVPAHDWHIQLGCAVSLAKKSGVHKACQCENMGKLEIIGNRC